jgi:photosystem II stability/assembly factor-like uncharacterized protein
MKLKLTILFFSSCLIFSNSTNAQIQWEKLDSAPSSFRLDDIFFLTPTKGWAIKPNYDYLIPGLKGAIYSTEDGGNSWNTLKDSSTTFYRSIGFSGTDTGWVGNLGNGSGSTTDTNFLYQTFNGGQSWTPVTNYTGIKPPGICGIFVVNKKVTYACGTYYGPPSVMKTTDNGKSWKSIDMSSYAGGLVDLYFTSPDTGFVIGNASASDNAIILYTTDGGTTWTTKYLGTIPSQICWKINFPSVNIGYVSIQRLIAQGGNYFLKTTDGGQNWEQMPFSIPAYNVEGIGFLNDTMGWIGGDNYKGNFKTINGGITWAIDSTFGVPISGFLPGFSINRFRRFGDSLMYASGNTVYKYKQSIISPPTFIANTSSQIESVLAYPNPFTEKITIEMKNPKNNEYTLKLFDITGNKVIEMKANNYAQYSFIIKKDYKIPAGHYQYIILNKENQVVKRGKLIAE